MVALSVEWLGCGLDDWIDFLQGKEISTYLKLPDFACGIPRDKTVSFIQCFLTGPGVCRDRKISLIQGIPTGAGVHRDKRFSLIQSIHTGSRVHLASY